MTYLDILKLKWFCFKHNCKGEVNIIAMVLIILVVIAVVAIFRSEMTDIVTQMFQKIRAGMELE
ncbi:MAG: hypothetical protein MJ129_03035 [Clostridia bacterium]|nr:hypothetical protein [Clostridia bacterium]